MLCNGGFSKDDDRGQCGGLLGSHGAIVARQRPVTAGQLQQRLRGSQRQDADCDLGYVCRLWASGGNSTAAAATWVPAAAVLLQSRGRGCSCGSSTPR